MTTTTTTTTTTTPIPDTASSDSTVPRASEPVTMPAPQAWASIGAGQYEVGVATIVIDDPNGVRPSAVDVWFPLDPGVDASALPPQQYTLLPGVYYQSPTALAAAADQAAEGQFPLIVYSHGSGGLRYIHSAYTERLASHGYVVVAPDHTGNTTVDRIAGTSAAPETIAFNRPTDVRRVIDAFVDPAHPTAGPYASHVDADHVVVTGHSPGGFTAIATVTGFDNEVGPVAADQRVDAIIAETIDLFALEGCAPGDIDDVRANEITTTYGLEFLDQVLNGGDPIDAARVAPPDDVIFQSR